MADRKFSQFTDGLTNQSPTDELVGLDVSLPAAQQNTRWTLNGLFSKITRNITDKVLRFQAGSSPTVSSNNESAIYSDGSDLLLSSNGSAYSAIAGKPVIGNGMQFVSPNGDDNNDGLSWGSAKLTGYAAYQALPSTGGTIYVADGSSWGGPVTNQGIWIVGPGDPTYTSPQTGWLRQKTGGGVAIIGIGKRVAAFGIPAAQLIGGSFTAADNKPWIWLSGINTYGSLFENLIHQYPAVAIRLGISPPVSGDCTVTNGSGAVEVTSGVGILNTLLAQTITLGGVDYTVDTYTDPTHFTVTPVYAGATGATTYSYTDRGTSTNSIKFRNVNWKINNSDSSDRGAGPAVDVGYVFWIWFEHCTGNGYTSAISAYNQDRGAVFLIKPEGYNSCGPFFIKDCVFYGGNIRYYTANSQWKFSCENTTFESSFVPLPPVIDFVEINNAGNAWISNFEVADASGTPSAVRVPASTSPGVVVVQAVAGAPIVGPATIASTLPQSQRDGQSSPLWQRQMGFFSGRVLGGIDAGRRLFSPSVARFSNLAPQTTSTWSAAIGSATVTTGQSSPDGLTNAATLSIGASTANRQIYRTSRTINKGDIIIAGVWARGSTFTTGTANVTNGLTVITSAAAFPSGGINSVIILDGVEYQVQEATSASSWTLQSPYTGATASVAFSVPAGSTSNSPVILINSAGSLYSATDNSAPTMTAQWAGDGEWQWRSGIYIVATDSPSTGNTGELILQLGCDSAHSMDYAYPILLHIPAGTISQNEAFELFNELPNWPDGAPVGSASLLRGQSLQIPSGALAVGTQLPNTAAIADLSSTTQGFLPPRMTEAQRDAIGSPPAGLMIYNTTTNRLNYRDNSTWQALP